MELTTNLFHSHDHEWIINICRSLEETLEDVDIDELTSISIFDVPKSLHSSKPGAYTPQVVSLGPYHHRRLELFEMEQHKLAAARRVQKKFKAIKLHELVAYIAENDIRIRSCYHRYLDFDQQTLAWMFAIDVSFLYEYMQTYPDKRKRLLSFKNGQSSLKNMGHLMDFTRRKIWQRGVLRDIIMLENQIPLFLIRQIHGLYPLPEENNRDKQLASMLMGLCKDLAPIKHMNEQRFEEECLTRAHLLELLYHTVAPNWTIFPIENDENQEKAKQGDEEEITGCLKAALSSIFRFLSLVAYAPKQFVDKIFKSKIVMGLITVALKVIAYFLKLRNKGSAVKEIVSSTHDVMEEADSVQLVHDDDSPLEKEIAIPSVEELSKIGVQFRPTKGGLNTIKFDKSSATFHLPVIHLDDNSEVVLRNLVAYEACIAPEGMVLTRYTELMNGIIDTEEDVRILREAGILLNRLKSDKEVASLWNGMTTSVKVTKVPIVDKAIEGANAYYSASWKVKVKETMKKYVYASWPCLTFLAANILILLSIVETVCTMYRCSKWLGA